MIIYLVILPEDQQFYARKDFHLIQNRFYDKRAAIDFLNENKVKYPTAKIVTAELSHESSQYHNIYKDRITFPAHSVINVNENPNLEQNQLDMAELMRRMNLNAALPSDNRQILSRAASDHDRDALLRAAFARLMPQPPVNRAQPAAAASPSPVQANRASAFRVVARRALPTELPHSLPELKAVLLTFLQNYIVQHPNRERRREIAELALQELTAKGKDMNPEEFKKFLQDAKKEIEKTPDHKASGLWRVFEEIIKKVDLQFLAVQNPNNNLVTQRFPFINESHLEKAKQLDLVDPVSGSIMENPVKVLPSGKYYDKSTIDGLKASGAAFICPLTRQPITKVEDAPEKKKEIEAFLQSARGNQFQPETLIPPNAPPTSGNKP